jgi:fatty-acyl-CoA synthase
MMFEKVFDAVEYHARNNPGNEALVLGEDRYNYRELKSAVDRCAMGLLDAGVRKGDRVATLSSPHPEFVITFLATASIGAIWIGLNPRYQLREFEYVVSNAQPCLLFTRTIVGDRDLRQDLELLASSNDCLKSLVVLNDDPAVSQSISYREFARYESENDLTRLKSARGQVEPDDPAMIIYTSGTIGKPKGALIPNRGLAKVAHVQLRYCNTQPLRMINFLPINHIGSVGDITCFALVGGGAIIFMEQFEPSSCLQLIQAERITLWGGVPTTFQMCLSLDDFEDYDLSSIQLIAWGGASAPAGLIRKLLTICPRLSTAYGQTESVGSVTIITPSDDIVLLSTTVGKPVPEYGFRIVDEYDQPVEHGKPGEVQVKGDFIMLGYWRDPEATAATLKDGWLKTGDLATQDQDGNVRLVGRLKEMFISGGYNIYPLEIEQVLESHALIAIAAVVAVPDELYSEVGYAWVQRKPCAQISEFELREFCWQQLANYKVPKRFFVEDELPLLPIGKLDKKKLKALSLESKARDSQSSHSANPQDRDQQL